MTIQKFKTGWITISDIVPVWFEERWAENRLATERYLYYTKKEAIAMFKKKYPKKLITK